MLSLKNISKTYKTGDFYQHALDNLSIDFRKNEFVAILGQSGSGKTTLLNIVGGLDRYDNGELIINGKSTRQFKETEWDAYRNNTIGFIFQSYNLLSHISVLQNVEMGMTLSGISAAKRRQKALQALERVGLSDHAKKKPNQLSGGQMQRVAIARALANDPDIILADEPTGALDSETSIQIMDLIKEIAKDKLVIMVTHNPDLAKEYSNRIIELRDGQVISDSNPIPAGENLTDQYNLKKTAMNYLTALNLSFKNIMTKKGRTFLTAFASSIGIIGIALILSLSNGFHQEVQKFQNEALSEFPVYISQSAMQMNTETMRSQNEDMRNRMMGKEPDSVNSDKVFLYNKEDETMLHKNIFTDDYMKYIESIDPEICNSIGYTRFVGMNLLRKAEGKVTKAELPIGMNMGSDSSMGSGMSSNIGILSSYPTSLTEGGESYVEKNYDLLAGSYPSSNTDMVLVVDSNNRVETAILTGLGFDTKDTESIKFADIVGTEIKLISNNDFYAKTAVGTFMPNVEQFGEMYESDSALTLKISGIIRLKTDVKMGLLGEGVAYSDDLVQSIIDTNTDSDIVTAQRDATFNVLTMQELNEEEKEQAITYLGGSSKPNMIYLYPKDFESKEQVLSYLEAYNKGKSEDDTIIYTDLANSISSLTGSIMDAITYVLVAFAAISLIVSLIMIGIITYISVLERTTEIGVLRALGARKKDITRVFNAETFIIGSLSGALGIAISYLLIIPINVIIEAVSKLPDVAKLNPLHAIILIIISVSLTLLGGTLPARMASKKDPVVALRSE